MKNNFMHCASRGGCLPNIIGNDDLRTKLYNDAIQGKLPHALVIEGPRGSGKHLIARSTAAALACRKDHTDNIPCFECDFCKKIMSDSSPDINIIGRGDHAGIGVDSVRFIRTDAPFMPVELDFKLYIIEDAHTMTSQAQNALLLTLEEPPSHVYFFLLCENSGALLETIKSRAPILRTEILGDDLVSDFLLRSEEFSSKANALRNDSPEEYNAMITSSGGIIGRAAELLDNKKRSLILKKREIASNFILLCANRVSNSTPLKATEMITLLSGKRDEVTAQLKMIETALRDLCIIKVASLSPSATSHPGRLEFYTDDVHAEELSSGFTLKKLITLCEACSEASYAISAKNANIRLTLSALFSKAGLL